MDSDTLHLESDNIDFYKSTNDDYSSSIHNPYVSIDKQRLCQVKQAHQIACKTCDEDFITLLKEYVNNKNHEALELRDDQENIGQIGNPIVRRPKGSPLGTTRLKGPLENSSRFNESAGGQNHQNKCGMCNNVGHNRSTCPLNPNRKKRKTN